MGLCASAVLGGVEGLVGEPEKKGARHVGDEDRVTWNGLPLALVGVRHIMLHKPAGVECTANAAPSGSMHIAMRSPLPSGTSIGPFST